VLSQSVCKVCGGFDTHGNFLRKFRIDSEGQRRYVRPASLAVDSANHVFVCNHDRVIVFEADGTLVTEFQFKNVGTRIIYPLAMANGSHLK